MAVNPTYGSLTNLGAPAVNPDCMQTPVFWAAIVFNTNQSTIVTRVADKWHFLASDNSTKLSDQTWRNLRTSENIDVSQVSIPLWRTFGGTSGLTCSPTESAGIVRLTPKNLDECCIDGQGYSVTVTWDVGCDGGSGVYTVAIPNPCTCGPTTREAILSLISEWETASASMKYDPIASMELVTNTAPTSNSIPYELRITYKTGVYVRVHGAGWSGIDVEQAIAFALTGAKLKALARDNNIHFTDGTSGDTDGAFSDSALYDVIECYIPYSVNATGVVGGSYGTAPNMSIDRRVVWLCGKKGTMDMATICSGFVNATTAHTFITACTCSAESELAETPLSYCVKRIDDGDATALTTIQGDYSSALSTDYVSMVRTGTAVSAAGDTWSYYTLVAKGGTPAEIGSDRIRVGACGDDDVAIIEGYES